MIEVTNLSKNFETHKKQPGLIGSIKSLFKREIVVKNAVKSVSLSIGEGEIVGLIGANGAGKTTLVKCLAGIVHPTSGSAKVLGHTPWERNKDFRKQIALIMGQKAQLWWDLPAEDNLLLIREIYRVPVKEFEERKNHLIETLGVRDLMNIQVRKLSLGERMKMELLACLLHNPRVVYLDEPTIGLDLTAQRAIRKFIKDYQQQHRPAMILTSHYMEDIEQLCKRIIIIRQGEIVYDGRLDLVVSQFAKHKTLTATLGTDAILAKDFERYGEVLSVAGPQVKIKVSRENISLVASEILKNHQLDDLNIVEPDISDIIENILRQRGPHVLGMPQ
jgi:ABC-2 type transport system ATP-binding protein